AGDGIRDRNVTGVQTCALPIWVRAGIRALHAHRPHPKYLIEQLALFELLGDFQPALFELRDRVLKVVGLLGERLQTRIICGIVRSEERRVGKEWDGQSERLPSR